MSAALLKTDQRAMRRRIVAGYITVSSGTPAISAGDGFTIADTAAGKVTITLSKPGKSFISAVATPVENTAATGYSCKIMGTPSGSAIVVGIYAADGTDGVLADDVGFCFQYIVKD